MDKKLVLSPKEETSILFDGDFDKNSYSKNLRLSFFQALSLKSKISDEIKFMTGMSGKKYRYLINHLVSLIENPRYLEIGSWAGSTVCSALYGNKAKAVCIDNWLKFDTEEYLKKVYNTKDQKKEFEENIEKIKKTSENIEFKFIESDFRKVNYKEIGNFNIYCYDALHDEKSQFEGIEIAQPALDDIFILIIDDWNWQEVRNGTLKAIEKLNISIISKIEIKTTQDNSIPKLFLGQYSDWHNGYFIAVCEKEKVKK
ncbi:MAG: hypothetical protein CBC24_04355 [Candidatus Pelagibacter sp. TMED64]|nr:hypothetical protein [Candidatus Pelagibacter sp.]OUU65894.1 MAG: hypothetical protein CBC24_04355 [Candidatus Pelagibacter sp. TMED64]|tara:strand:+ start:1702 stop:2472 length:771 start_codon:yes stop_codon:yes gene_type:complete